MRHIRTFHRVNTVVCTVEVARFQTVIYGAKSYGGAGADTLTGGAGADTFAYSASGDFSGAKVDTVTNFEVDNSGTDDIFKLNSDTGDDLDVGGTTLDLALEGGLSGNADANVAVFNSTAIDAGTLTEEIDDLTAASDATGTNGIIGIAFQTGGTDAYLFHDSSEAADNAGSGVTIIAKIEQINGSALTGAADLGDIDADNFTLVT